MHPLHYYTSSQVASIIIGAPGPLSMRGVAFNGTWRLMVHVPRNPLLNLSFLAADPAIYIPPGDVIYAAEGSVAEIIATVYSSNTINLIVEWYHRGNLINTESDARYTASMQGTLYTLTIMGVETDLLGMYHAVVTHNRGNSQFYSVQLAFQGIQRWSSMMCFTN